MKVYGFIKKIRSALLVYLTHKMALPVLKLIRKPVIFPYSAEELKSFPADTLGKDLVNFLKKKELHLLPYYAKHDIKHILLGYDTTDEGEVCLQCFMLGNGHISFPVAATVLFGLITMPEHWKKFKAAYKRGGKCESIANWAWFEILQQPTQSLIQKVNA
jgi:ubiquinone biosynthesis protein Coq4